VCTDARISFTLERRRNATQIDIAPETERLVREEISSGHFHSVDELIRAGVEAWRERTMQGAAPEAAPKCLVQFFRESPLVGLELDF
jgi:Arc/MetJ-type ribon-helix-helix transcriptional regulator